MWTVQESTEYCFRLYIPCPTPVLATIAVNVFLGQWNNWNTAMLYIDDSKLYSLQYMLPEGIIQNLTLLQNNQDAAMMFSDAAEVPAETVRMTMAVVVGTDIILYSPFSEVFL